MRTTPFTKEKENLYSTVLKNVPAFLQEPYMPPRDQTRSWILAYYPPSGYVSPEVIKGIYDESMSSMKVDGEVQRAATAAMGNATTPEQKLERLFEFCRSNIKNVNDDASELAYNDRSKLKENKSPSDTLKRGMGTGTDINRLFGALVTAAGFVARVAYVADRSDIFYKPESDNLFLNFYFMRSTNIGVQVGNEWQFFDPATTHVPYGMLRWQEEGRTAMMFDPYYVLYRQTPLSPPEKSLAKRTAKLL